MDVRRFSNEFYHRARGIVTPTLEYSQSLYEGILKHHVNPTIRWLDLGCGHQILPSWREEEERLLANNSKIIVGIDYDQPSLKHHKNILLKVRGTITELPFKNNSFDLVTANMVVEHLDNPDVQFQEVHRVLNPGGIFIFHTPNALGYFSIVSRLVPEGLKKRLVHMLDGRRSEDIFKAYYRANTKKRINALARATGFEVVTIKMIVTDAVFAVVPPLVIPELVWIRMLMTRPLKPFRTNMIAVLKKQRGSRNATELDPPEVERAGAII